MRYQPAIQTETFRINNLNLNVKKRPQIKDIKNTIYFYLRIDEDEADSKYRNRELVEARQFVHAICAKYKDKFHWSFKRIGEETGEREHATVMHSKKVVACHCEIEKDYNEKYNRILRIVKNRFNL